jgi:tRNA G18 (ribose-2'-O)-methylase SpoU
MSNDNEPGGGDDGSRPPEKKPLAEAEEASTATASTSQDKKMYLVLTNISKRSNIRSLLMTAAAFGCRGIFVVGQKQFDWSPEARDVPSQLRDHIATCMPIIHFNRWEECVCHLRGHGIFLVGVEIHPDAQNIDTFQHEGKDVAFLMGNEGQGLHEKHMASCDTFVMISQYGGGTASLNVYVAASIVLHRYHERLRQQRN